MEFLRRDTDGVQVIPATELPPAQGLDLGVWQGASSGLLDGDDLALIGEQMTAGAVVVVFENLWVLDVVRSWTAAGGRLLLDGGFRPRIWWRRWRRPGRSEEVAVGLLKTAVKVAVASSVHGRVQRRQQERWARQEARLKEYFAEPETA